MYLDAKEIFRLSCDAKSCLEGDDAVDIWHGGLACIGVAVPRAVVLPCQAVCRLAVLHDCRNAVVVIGGNIIVLTGFLTCIGNLALRLLPCGKFRIEFVNLVLVGVVLLAVFRRIVHARTGYLLHEHLVLSLQLTDLRLQRSDFIVSFLLLLVEFAGVEVVIRDGAHHGALLGMAVERLAAGAALVLCIALTKCHAVGTGDADGDCLHSFEFAGIGGLVIVARITANVVGIALFIVVILRKACLQLTFEGVQVHSVGVEHVFIHFFHIVPTLLHMNFVSIGFLRLTFLLAADDVGREVVGEGISKTVLLVVHLLHLAS